MSSLSAVVAASSTSTPAHPRWRDPDELALRLRRDEPDECRRRIRRRIRGGETPMSSLFAVAATSPTSGAGASAVAGPR